MNHNTTQLQEAKKRLKTNLGIDAELVMETNKKTRYSTERLLVMVTGKNEADEVRSMLSDMYPEVVNTLVSAEDTGRTLGFNVDFAA